MCKYCERATEVGWNQPHLPYDDKDRPFYKLNGNIVNFDNFYGVIHEYQTSESQLILKCDNYFGKDSIGTIYIPIKHCPECGRKLGEESNG